MLMYECFSYISHALIITKFSEKSAVILSEISQLPTPENIFLDITIWHLLGAVDFIPLRPNMYLSLHLPLTGDYSGLYSISFIPSLPNPNPNPL